MSNEFHSAVRSYDLKRRKTVLSMDTNLECSYGKKPIKNFEEDSKVISIFSPLRSSSNGKEMGWG